MLGGGHQLGGRRRPRVAVQQHREVLARLANKPESELFAQSEALGAAALAICEVASVCDMAAVGEAAQGVYAVVRALRSHGLWHTAALTAHIRSLLLLTSDPAPTEAETRKILDRLTGMRAFVGVPA